MVDKEKEFGDELVKLFKGGITFLGICLLVIFGLYLYNFGSQGLSNQQEVWGQLGDFVGGLLNPIISTLTLCLLLLTIKLQRDMLRAARRQVEVSEEELKKTSKALQEQNNAVAKQSFEATFFSMLTLWQRQSSEIDLQTGGKDLHGKDSFSSMYNRLKIDEQRYIDPNPELAPIGRGPLPTKHIQAAQARIKQNSFLEGWNQLPNRIDKQECLVPYLILYVNHDGDLGHYYRTLFQILKYVDQSKLPDRQKRFYTNLVRAQFSPQEHALFFYNALSPMGLEKMMPLVEKYSLLKNLEISYLLDPDHASYCQPSAWAPSPKIFDDELSANIFAIATTAVTLN